MKIIKLIIALIMLPIVLVNVIDSYKPKTKARAAIIVAAIYKNIFIALSSLVAAPIAIMLYTIIHTAKIINAIVKGTVNEGNQTWSRAQHRKNAVFCTNLFSDVTLDKNKK